MLDLVSRFQNQVFGLCYRMLGNREDAEDAAQESLVRMLRSLSHWDPQRDFERWLLAIAGNRCRTALAARFRRPKMALLEEPVADPTSDFQASQNLAEELHRALAELRPEYRQAFCLFHELEMSYTEIAATMNCPVGTAKTWVHRARRELIGRLAQRGIVQESRDAVPGV